MATSVPKARLLLLTAAVAFAAVAPIDGAEPDSRDGMVRTTKNGKPFAAVVDIFPQLCLGPNTPAQIEEEVALLAEVGFQRLYFVVCLPGYPSFSSPWLSIHPPNCGSNNHALESIVALDSPNFIFCRMAKKYGMEAYAVMKPYEGGGGATIPAGARLFWEDGGRQPCVGGERIMFDSLLAAHPEMRVQRKPIPEYDKLVEQPFQRIELAFCLDEIPATKRAKAIPAAPANYRCEDHPVAFTLWSSTDNGSYVEVDGPCVPTERIDSRIVRDVNGQPLFPEPKRCRVVTFPELKLPESTRYLGVSMAGDKAHLRRLQTIPSSMFRAFGIDGEIPVTVALHSRRGTSPAQNALPAADRLWGLEGQPQRGTMGFAKHGFEFEWHGADIWFGDGWHSNTVYGLGRGRIMAMKGTHCEAYPEVRAYWLDQIDALIAMGYDGVDIRLQNHSSMVGDFANFGFNPPLVERYRETYGVDPLREEVDPLRMMAVRGRFFLEFLAEAANRLHRNGRRLQVHLRGCHRDPKLRSDFNELGFWAMPKIWLQDWKAVVDLADEVTIKDYYWGHYEPERARPILQYARSHGKPVWIHNYIGQGDAIREEFIQAVSGDPNVSGILLYEVLHAGRGGKEPNQGLINMVDGHMSYHEAAREALLRVSKLSPRQ